MPILRTTVLKVAFNTNNKRGLNHQATPNSEYVNWGRNIKWVGPTWKSILIWLQWQTHATMQQNKKNLVLTVNTDTHRNNLKGAKVAKKILKNIYIFAILTSHSSSVLLFLPASLST